MAPLAAAQVEAGLWVRNGGQVLQAVAAYGAVQPEEARDLDLLLLQIWLASSPADRCSAEAPLRGRGEATRSYEAPRAGK